MRRIAPTSSRPPVLVAGAVAAAILASAASLSAQTTDPPPYVPTDDRLVDTMLDLGGVGSGDLVFDLGSGDGRLVVGAALRGARGIGVEIDPGLIALSWSIADSAGVRDRVDFRREDLFRTDVSGADAVMLYLSHHFNQQLRPRLLHMLGPGARIVSHAFHMGPWQPDTTVTIGQGAARATIFAWTVPAVVDGFWYLRIDGTAGVNLEIQQEFQRLDGTIRRAGRALHIQEGRMDGTRITFEVVESVGGRPLPLRFTGALGGDRLKGVVEGPEEWGTRVWEATRFSAE